MRKSEGGNRNNLQCITSGQNGKHFNLLSPINNDFMDWFIKKYNIKICELYYPPYNFNRTGCLSCPYALKLKQQLEVLKKYDPISYKQSRLIWKPVYDEYERIGYRLEKKNNQMTIFDFIDEE